jgi:hypothetical protein
MQKGTQGADLPRLGRQKAGVGAKSGRIIPFTIVTEFY